MVNWLMGQVTCLASRSFGPEFAGEMHLVCDGTDNDDVRSERSAMVAECTEIGDLGRSQFEHQLGRNSRLISSAASCARGSEEYISSA